MHSNAERRNNTNFSARGDDGLVAAFKGNHDRLTPRADEKEFARFREDFKRAFTNAAQPEKPAELGLLLKYSYWDSSKLTWDGGVVDTSKAPWDILATEGELYSQFGSGEERTINIAIREGLIDKLPDEVHYISLGPGEGVAFRGKDSKLINAMVANSHRIVAATAIDINDRYAREAAATINETYGCDAYALKRDFLWGNLPDIKIRSGATPLVAIFGGTLQNMPKTNAYSRTESTVDFFKTMRKGLPTAHVVMSVDATPENIDQESITMPYRYSLENELFVLNFMAHAKEKGLITDPHYNILKNWRITDPEWADNAVNIYIVAKNDHTLPTIDGSYEIKAGQRVSVSTSKKGPIQLHKDTFEKAGFDVQEYPQGAMKADGTLKYILHATPKQPSM